MGSRKSLTLVAALVASTLAFSLSFQVAEAAAPYLQWIGDYDFATVPYIASNPHGKLNVLVSVYKLLHDSTGSFDWYFYHIQIQSVPGTVAYASDWETSNHVGNHAVFNYGTSRWLKDYDPTTTNGFWESSKSVSISVQDKPQLTFTWTDSYTIPYVSCVDQSDYSIHRARWLHDFNEGNDPYPGSPSDSTFRVRPWFVVRTTQNAWTMVDAYYTIQFARYYCEWRCDWWHCWMWCGWGFQDFAGATKYLDAQRTGDT